MSHQMALDSLHSSLSLETAKLVRWEVKTVVNMRDREGQIQLTAGVTATQEQMIPQLEEENLRLRGELSAAKHDKEDLGQRISFTRRELEVLGSQFVDLQGELERLKGEPVVNNEGRELEVLTVAVKEMRIKAATYREETKRSLEELEMTRRTEGERGRLSKKEMVERIKETRREVERRENTVLELKDKLQVVTDKVLDKKIDLDESTAGLAEVEERKATLVASNSHMRSELGGEISRLTSMVEQMDKEKVDMLEQLEKRREIANNQKVELHSFTVEKHQKLAEKTNMDAVIFKMEGDCKLLRGQVEVVMVELDRLDNMVGEEDKVEKDLEMLRADLRVSEENRKMVESEVVAIRRVEQQKVGLEKENMNMKGRAEMLAEKEESYKEDLVVCKSQMEEMAAKKVDVKNQLQDLEEEDFRWEEEMAALNTAVGQAMEEAKMTEAGNKELEEKIEDLMKSVENSVHFLRSLELEETAVSKDLKSVEDEVAQIQAAIESAEVEGMEKVAETEAIHKQVEEATSKLTLFETGLSEKLETRQVIKEILISLESQEEQLNPILELKRNEYEVICVESKGQGEEYSILEDENKALIQEKTKLLDNNSALQAELEVKRTQMVGMGSQMAKEVEITRKRHEECLVELEGVKKEVLDIVDKEEEFVKELETIELLMKSQKLEIAERSQVDENLKKELITTVKEGKSIDKELKLKSEGITTEELKLMNEKKGVQVLKKNLIESEKKRNELEGEIEQMQKKKVSDLEHFRAALDKKVLDHNENIKQMEVKKDELKIALKETENKMGKIDLEKKTASAKKNLEKLDKSKDCKVKKEKMMEEKRRLETTLSETKKVLETQKALVKSLQAEVKKSQSAVEVEMVGVDSDEENLTVRKVFSRSPSTTPLRNRSLLSLPSSTSTKKKLEDTTTAALKSGLDNIYQFGDSSDSEGQSQPKFQVPSTPRGRTIFSSRSVQQVTTTTTPRIKQQQVPPTPHLVKSVSSTSPLRTFAMPQARLVRPTRGEKKVKKMKESGQEPALVNFDQVMVVSSDLDSC